ncbi:dNA (Cytosine-5-)-methyltransferase domain protein [Clostridium sp. CAG:306]|nr:dNA (Cytosine-5-)-methyltransferase domain protein [Clostridium sp. CAG:306]
MATRYIPYFPEPIEGQAILNNFVRTLKYNGNDKIKEHLKRGMPLYEVEKLETVGANPDNNMVIRGECISACAYLRDRGIKVDLVYIDPPFASGADYAKKVYLRRNPKVAEAIKQAEEEIEMNDDFKAFEEKMYGDVWNKEDYLNWMYENLLAIKSIMSETASIYVHLDWHIGHYVKILMDEIFGEDNFRNEIIWSYSTLGRPKDKFASKHDNIFAYGKSECTYFNEQEAKIPYTKEYIASHFKDVDELGKQCRKRFDAGKWRTYYPDEGMIPNDVWDIAYENSMSLDRVDYATQKPEALLYRIIKASSNKNMVVADFFGGSGVTAKVANDLNRKFIHCDIGINSIQTTRDRLVASKAEFDVLEINDGVSLYRNPVQTMDKMKSLIKGLRNEDALAEFWEGAIQDSKEGLIPVYVPNLMDSSTKLLDKALMTEIIRVAIPDLPDEVKKVIVYYIDITSLEEIKQMIDEDDTTTIEIELRDLKELLTDVVVEDHIEYSLDKIQEKQYTEYEIKIDKFVSDRVIQKINEYNARRLTQCLKTAKDYKPITLSDNGLETIEYISVDCTNTDGIWKSDSEIKIDKNSYVIFNGNKTKDFWNGTIKSEKKPLRLKVRNICGDESIIKL